MKLHFQCAEQAMSTSNLSKYCACHEIFKFKIAAETLWIASANRKTIRRHSDDIPTIIRPWNRHLAPAASETLLVPSWRRILYGKIQHFALRLSPKMSPNAAPATKSDNPTSPNTAPATQNESHDWCASHMKRHFQCAEQAMSTSNLSKYCACHEIFKFKISAETPWIASANRKTIRRHSDDIPTIIRPWNRHLAPAASETLLVPSWRRFCMEKYNISRSGYLPKCHQMLRLPRKVTLQLQQILRLPRKMNLLASIRSWHLFTLGIYSLLASILSWHLFSFGIYSLLASILSWHLFPLGIYSLLASIPSWHLFSLGIYSLLASILSWHLFARHLFSRHLFSWHLFSRHLFSWHLFSWHLFSWHLFSLAIYSLGIYSLLASIL